MGWFYNVLGATLGLGLGLVVVVAALGIVALVIKAMAALLDEGRDALARYAVREEVVIEEYDAYKMEHRVRYLRPTPDRVRLAREGKPGERLMRSRTAA